MEKHDLGGVELAHEVHRHEEHVVREVARRNDYFLGASILVSGVLVAGAVIYSVGAKSGPGAAVPPAGGNPTPPAAVTAPVIGPGDVILGDANAKVTLIEFADYQCPFCGRFHTQTSPLVRDNYIKTGKVKMVYRDFAFLGPESIVAAEAARCAADQAKFWEYHDALYAAETKDGQENNGNLNRDLLVKLAGTTGLNIPQFTSCIDGKKYNAQVLKAKDEAAAFSVNSTPTTFVNSQQIIGAQPYAAFQAAIEAELKK